MYPFGYGLSYTQFRYCDLQVEKNGQEVQVRVRVENIGDRDGKEVVQLYVHEEKPTVDRPVRELKAFQKIALKAGQSREVAFTLTEEAFSYYCPERHSWVANDGVFQIQIGRNVQDIALSAALHR